MPFPTTTYTSNRAAGAALTNTAQAAGLSVSGLEPIAQLQSVVANLLTGTPSTVQMTAADVLSGTFGANKTGGADTGTYAFPGLVTTADSLSVTKSVNASVGVTVTNVTNGASTNAALSLYGGAIGTTGSQLLVTVASSAAGGDVTLASTCNSLATNTAAALNIKNVSAAPINLYANNAVQLSIIATANAVNYVTMNGGAAGSAVRIAAMGSDTNINITYDAKGANGHFFRTAAGATTIATLLATGSTFACNVTVGPSTATNLVVGGGGAAIATTATAGFLFLSSCAGTPTGVPASIPTGTIATVYDTTANKIWFYNGSWRGVLVA